MAATGALDVTDLEEIVKDYAVKFLDKEQKKQADTANPEVDWSRCYIRHGETKYADLDKGSPQVTPKSHILFSAHFSNNTDANQTYSLKTSRSTTSTCQLDLSKAYTIGASVSISLVPPNPILDANAGFEASLSMSKGVSETFTEELTWGVDSDIVVKPKHTAQADLVIKEDNFCREFTIETQFQGRVLVTYINKKEKYHVSTVSADVVKVFRHERGFKVYPDDPERPGVFFTTSGTCRCRFGVEQHVNLHQRPLNGPSPT